MFAAPVAHPYIFGAILVTLSAVCAVLGRTGSTRQHVFLFLAGLTLLGALAGIGAVFGKVLGDFLRNVNG